MFFVRFFKKAIKIVILSYVKPLILHNKLFVFIFAEKLHLIIKAVYQILFKYFAIFKLLSFLSSPNSICQIILVNINYITGVNFILNLDFEFNSV